MYLHAAPQSKGGQFCPTAPQILPCGIRAKCYTRQARTILSTLRTSFDISEQSGEVSANPTDASPLVPDFNRGGRGRAGGVCAKAPKTPGGSSSVRLRHE